MLSGLTVVLVCLAYLGVLFAIAHFGDRRADQGRSIIDNAYVYALSLAVYCTAWTYFGSVGRAASSGISFLPVYLGPTLGMALAWLILLKMVRISKAYRITSIADFIASRYGKSHVLGGLVSVIALIGTVPYIALQLKAVSSGIDLLVPADDALAHVANGGGWFDTTLLIALALATFTILFGTRHLDAAERHEGMVAAIAFESLVKLGGFLAIGIYVTFILYDGVGDIFRRAAADPALSRLFTLAQGSGAYGNWFTLTLLSMFSVFLLPRQFQVAVVENVNEHHIRRAIWVFPAYLLLINLFVIPIALGGLMHFGVGGVDPDTFVLTLPLSHDHQALALLVFIGGLSAATGMVIVETIAVSTMVCNDLVMPLVLRYGGQGLARERDLTGLLLTIRRGAILLILLLGYVYFRVAGEAYALVGIGLISFAAVAQFAPALLGAMYWRGGTHLGAMGGLSAGFLVWGYTLLLPSFAKSGWLDASFLTEGPWGIGWLRPEHLFGMTGLDSLSHALFWSLFANCGAYLVGSALRPPNAAEAGQATMFVDVARRTAGVGTSFWRGTGQVRDLVTLVGRFLGPQRAEDAFLRYARLRGWNNLDEMEADPSVVQFAEIQLAGAIGSASARAMVATTVKEEVIGIDEVMEILDEASQVRAYSHQLEEKSRALEAATAELRAANERMKELDRLKDDFMSSVSHELRTPLTSIRAFSEMLCEDPKIDLEDRKRFLGIIVSETVRLTRLVNQVLDMAKIESGHVEWQNAEVDLREVITQAVDSVSQMLKDRGQDVHVVVPDTVPILWADRDRLVQVVLNLLSNGSKFAPKETGVLDVRMTANEEHVRVDVTDNGPGIAEAEQGLIFEKFRQGGDIRDKPQGTGLGLPISRQIVEHFGGRLWVTSQVGAGATFSFELPVGWRDDAPDGDAQP
ncbi:MAG: histidine kinase [Zoogloeaceae bacterium]|nr:histidine kinase [Zoogloeaceae bacterium]